MIVRLLLLAALVWLLVRLWRQWRSDLAASVRKPPPEPGYELMSPCRGCGTYLPTKTLSSGGRCGKCGSG
jgi:hypothetical protein